MSDEREETSASPTATARSSIRSALADALSKGVSTDDSVQNDDEPELDLAADERETMAAQRGEAPRDDEPKPRQQSADPKYKALHRQRQRDRERLDRERASLAAEREALRHERDARTEREELADLRREAKESPEKAADRLGISLDDLNRRKLLEGSPEARIEALERRLEQRDRAADDRETEAQQQRRQASERYEIQAFVSEVEKDDDCWALHALEPEDLVPEAMRVANEITAYIRSRGGDRVATNREIRAELQARHASRIDKINAKRGGTAPLRVAPPPAARPQRDRPARRTDEPETTHTPTRGDRVKALANALARRR